MFLTTFVYLIFSFVVNETRNAFATIVAFIYINLFIILYLISNTVRNTVLILVVVNVFKACICLYIFNTFKLYNRNLNLKHILVVLSSTSLRVTFKTNFLVASLKINKALVKSINTLLTLNSNELTFVYNYSY